MLKSKSSLNRRSAKPMSQLNLHMTGGSARKNQDELVQDWDTCAIKIKEKTCDSKLNCTEIMTLLQKPHVPVAI